MKTFCLAALLLFCSSTFSQPLSTKLNNAMNILAKDPQFEHSIISMYLVNSKTGAVVYTRNSDIGLAPASCQKIVTSVTAFELLGKDYHYQTALGYDGVIEGMRLKGNLIITGTGDPTFGSWRWKQTSAETILKKMKEELAKNNIQSVSNFIIDNTKWGTQTLPTGWVWEDIGQYYGAGCSAFNWHENQYDIVLKPGKKTGDPVEVLSVNPAGVAKTVNELTTAAAGTGDQVYVYHSPYSTINFLRGTAALDMDTLVVSASSIDGQPLFEYNFLPALAGTVAIDKVSSGITNYLQTGKFTFNNQSAKMICSFSSPSFDSMNYWFLKKSLNLYGEAFLKTIAFEETNFGTTDSGVSVVRNFWTGKGIEKSALKILDGSGLSPSNRVTTKALVTILQYAKQRPWFNSFYDALPEMNGIKMKDGYIGGVRSYTGYVKSVAGTEYSFAFIINNFDGNPRTAREKIWRLLDLMK